jgi:hypothetical protein
LGDYRFLLRFRAETVPLSWVNFMEPATPPPYIFEHVVKSPAKLPAIL